MTFTEPTTYPYRDRWNDRLVREIPVTGPASYVTGGDPFASADLQRLGLSEVYGVYGILRSSTATMYPVFDYANQKIMYFTTAGAQVGNGTDVSAFAGTLLITGKA